MPKLIVYDESPDAPTEVLECSFLKEDEFVTGPERTYIVREPDEIGGCWVTQAKSRIHALAKFAAMVRDWGCYVHVHDDGMLLSRHKNLSYEIRAEIEAENMISIGVVDDQGFVKFVTRT